MDAFAITGIAAGDQHQGEPEWFRVQGAVGGYGAAPRLFPRIHVVKRETIADMIAGGRIVYIMSPANAHDHPDRARVRIDADGHQRIEAVTVGGTTESLEELPRFPFCDDASEADLEALRAIGRGGVGVDEIAAAERYVDNGWVGERNDDTLCLTDIGRDLVRSRYM
ncbi:MAG TPA: hypothetical protein VNG69_14395 [Casimicrobiaceae bacterium]|nr:hypothetical protein [Casimicrobiaceae bacterium]